MNVKVRYSEKLHKAIEKKKAFEKPCVSSKVDVLPKNVMHLKEIPSWIKRYIPINCQPHPYQYEGVKWMTERQFGGILDWEPGSGKTFTSLLHMNLTYSMSNLVIVNKSQLIVWKEEIHKFYDDRFTVLGAHKEIGKCLCDCTQDELESYDIVLTTYESISSCFKYKTEFTQVYWNNVYCDEVHRLRNSNTDLYQIIDRIRRKKFWGLTGSLIFNKIQDARNIQSLVHEDSVYSLANINSVRLTDVGVKLPDLIMKYVYTGFTKKQKMWYENYKMQAEDILNTLKPKNKRSWGAIFAILTRLRQITISPKLLEGSHDVTFEDEDGYKSPRIESICNQIEASEGQGVVFCFFRDSLEMIKRNLRERGFRCKIIKAEHNTKQKTNYIDMFKNGEYKVILSTYKTGGLGFNLTNANNVFLCSLWWNWEIIAQAFKRCFRPGQTKNVNVYYFLKRESIEDRMMEICKSKGEMSDNFLLGNRKPFKISKEIMKMLF